MIGYLLAGLPTPRWGEPSAIAPDAFLDACRRSLPPARARELAALFAGPTPTLAPEELEGDAPGVGAPPVLGVAAQAWADLAAHVDDAVARARGARTGRDPRPYLRAPPGLRADVLEAVARAFEVPDPAAREVALDRLRWRLADELASHDPDGFAALFARAVQLRLAARRVRWDVDAGWATLEATLRRIERKLEATPGAGRPGDEAFDG